MAKRKFFRMEREFFGSSSGFDEGDRVFHAVKIMATWRLLENIRSLEVRLLWYRKISGFGSHYLMPVDIRNQWGRVGIYFGKLNGSFVFPIQFQKW